MQILLKNPKQNLHGRLEWRWNSLFPFFIALSLSLTSCFQSKISEEEIVKFSGYAQGTTYNITYLDPEQRSFQMAVDSILIVIDQSMSLWVDTSLISRINRGEDMVITDHHFLNVFEAAQQIARESDGAFDFTIGPLVNAWGFGYTGKVTIDSSMVDSLLELVGFEGVRIEDGKVGKKHPGSQIDFNAIAQGYTVDVLSGFLEDQGIRDYLVEVGGELRARGHNPKDEPWKIGIDKPIENAERQIQAVVNISGKSLATSGNYRKFHEDNGIKYSHTIDPKTGYPARHSLLSATVVANECMTADAWATAYMVMGLEKAKKHITSHPELEAYFIYGDENGNFRTWMSDGLKNMVEER